LRGKVGQAGGKAASGARRREAVASRRQGSSRQGKLKAGQAGGEVAREARLHEGRGSTRGKAR
jgi:hypothetical protein